MIWDVQPSKVDNFSGWETRPGKISQLPKSQISDRSGATLNVKGTLEKSLQRKEQTAHKHCMSHMLQN